MLSLSKLKSIEVTVHDNALPVVVFDQVEISDEDSYNEEVAEEVTEEDRTPKTPVTIECLLTLAKAHLSKKHARLTAENYIKCWADSMSELIEDSGHTKNEFIKLVKA